MSTSSSSSTPSYVHSDGIDYYAVFSPEYPLNPSSSAKDIARAFRKLSVILHPDKNPSESAKQRYESVKLAFEFLENVEERKKYDDYIYAQQERTKKLEKEEKHISILRNDLERREAEAELALQQQKQQKQQQQHYNNSKSAIERSRDANAMIIEQMKSQGLFHKPNIKQQLEQLSARTTAASSSSSSSSSLSSSNGIDPSIDDKHRTISIRWSKHITTPSIQSIEKLVSPYAHIVHTLLRVEKRKCLVVLSNRMEAEHVKQQLMKDTKTHEDGYNAQGYDVKLLTTHEDYIRDTTAQQNNIHTSNTTSSLFTHHPSTTTTTTPPSSSSSLFSSSSISDSQREQNILARMRQLQQLKKQKLQHQSNDTTPIAENATT